MAFLMTFGPGLRCFLGLRLLLSKSYNVFINLPLAWQSEQPGPQREHLSNQKWGKLMLVYRPSEADIVILVQSRPSEDVLAVYDGRTPGGQYLWRAMGRDGLQSGETPLVTSFEKGFEGVQPKSGK